MEQWPEKQIVNTIRFVCKLYKSGTTGVYDFNHYTSVTEMLRLIKPFICEKCNINNFKLLYNSEIIVDSDDSIKKVFTKDYINLIIKPDYMYSIPESIFYKDVSKVKSSRISYLIKIDAVKTIQKFFRNITTKECPCCYEKCFINKKYYRCDHLICEECFNKWNLRNDKCPTCREPVKQNYRIIDNVELSEFWNIFRDNINVNNDEVIFPPITNTTSTFTTTPERILNIFPESHSDRVLYSYSNTNNRIHNIISDMIEQNINSNIIENNNNNINNNSEIPRRQRFFGDASDAEEVDPSNSIWRSLMRARINIGERGASENALLE